MPTSFKRREPRQPGASRGATGATTAQAGAASIATPLGKDEGPSQVDSNGRTLASSSSLAETGRGASLKGLHPSPFPSPVPLFSTGLASLDDLICGYGVPSSSLIALCPSVGMANDVQSASDASRSLQDSTPSARSLMLKKSLQYARTLQTALAAADNALVEILCHGIAQGLMAEHDTLVVGKNVEDMVLKRVPAYAVSAKGKGLLSDGRSDATEAGAKEVSEAAKETGQDDDEMKIAFRYAHRPKFKTTVDEPNVYEDTTEVPDEHRFRAPLDMSRRWSREEVASQQQRYREAKGGLCLIDTTSYSEALRSIVAEVSRRDKNSERGSSVPALRIHLVALGGAGWSRASESMDRRLVRLTRFLHQLRALLKRLALGQEQSGKARRHAICTFTVSPDVLSSPWRSVVTHHLLRIVDVELLLSDFSTDEQLCRAYAGYNGSVYLVKGPAIGALLPPGENRSILRGGTSEAGAENDVGWRQKKRGRGIVIETLHEDVDAGQTTKDEGVPSKAMPKGDDIEEAALHLSRRSKPGKEETHAHDHRHHDHSHSQAQAHPEHTHDTDSGSGPGQVGLRQVSRPSESAPTKPRKFEGLKSLRERGLQVSQQQRQHEQQQQ